MNPQSCHSSSGDCTLLQSIGESQAYRDFETAFTQATGLPLCLMDPDARSLTLGAADQASFAGLMARSKGSVVASPDGPMQPDDDDGPRLAATLRAYAGLAESAVPVRAGGEVVAFLHTGQVLLQRPTKTRFHKLAQALRKWGAQVDLEELEEAYFNTRYMAPEQYEAHVRLLSIFAGHLGASGNALMLQEHAAEPPSIHRARAFIENNYRNPISLAQVAQVATMSPTYFSEKFHEITRMKFVDFVSRTRIERARHLLEDPDKRVTEAAFAVGFQSLSQFNRAFRHFTGQSPSRYRATLQTAAKGRV